MCGHQRIGGELAFCNEATALEQVAWNGANVVGLFDEHLHDFAVAGEALRNDLGQRHKAGRKDDG